MFTVTFMMSATFEMLGAILRSPRTDLDRANARSLARTLTISSELAYRRAAGTYEWSGSRRLHAGAVA
jgi:hypothetical protein